MHFESPANGRWADHWYAPDANWHRGRIQHQMLLWLAHTHRKHRLAALTSVYFDYFPFPFTICRAWWKGTQPHLCGNGVHELLHCWMSHQHHADSYWRLKGPWAAQTPTNIAKTVASHTHPFHKTQNGAIFFQSLHVEAINKKKLRTSTSLHNCWELILQPRELLGIKTLMSTWLQGLVQTSGEASIKPEARLVGSCSKQNMDIMISIYLQIQLNIWKVTQNGNSKHINLSEHCTWRFRFHPSSMNNNLPFPDTSATHNLALIFPLNHPNLIETE